MRRSSRDPALYALLALVPEAQPWQRARVLLQILRASHASLDDGTRAVLGRVARVLLVGIPAEGVLTVLLALRRLRANHKHTTRAIVQFVLDHPDADLLALARRPALVDCLEHAIGNRSSSVTAHSRTATI